MVIALGVAAWLSLCVAAWAVCAFAGWADDEAGLGDGLKR
jgi:hypothetical protein